MYQEEEQSRLRRQASKEAITLALQGNWKEAIAINKTLIEKFPADVEALNRLGRAHMELSEYKDAEAAYRKTLEVDQYNAIAQKNLQRLSYLKKTKSGPAGGEATHKLEPQQFIEEIGKAGVVNITNLAKPALLARFVAGDIVALKVVENNLTITNSKGEQLGVVEPRHGQRLVRLIRGGNKYTASIVSSTDKAVTVIIRETYKDPSQLGQLSFPTRGIEAARPDIADRVIRREMEQEDASNGDAGYTVVGGEEPEALAERRVDDDFDEDGE